MYRAIGAVLSGVLVATLSGSAPITSAVAAPPGLNVGVHEDWTAGGRTPTQVKVRYPGAKIGRAFIARVLSYPVDLRPKARNVLLPYLAAKTPIVYLSAKSDVADTIRGDWDVQYRELGTYLDTLQKQHGVTIIFIPYHEPEDDLTAAQFVPYFNRVRAAVKLGSSAIQVKPCYMSYQWLLRRNGQSVGGKTDNPTAWFRNIQATDGVTVDVYSGRSFPLELTLSEHPAFRRWISYVPATWKWSVTERGWDTPSSTNRTNRSALRVKTMNREFAEIRSRRGYYSRLIDYVIWSSPGTEGARGLVLDRAGEDAVARFIAN